MCKNVNSGTLTQDENKSITAGAVVNASNNFKAPKSLERSRLAGATYKHHCKTSIRATPFPLKCRNGQF